jgi:hypothetical protein
MKESRMVFTMFLALVGCETRNARVVTALNRSAILEGNLPINPLGWSVITSELNPAAVTHLDRCSPW